LLAKIYNSGVFLTKSFSFKDCLRVLNGQKGQLGECTLGMEVAKADVASCMGELSRVAEAAVHALNGGWLHTVLAIYTVLSLLWGLARAIHYWVTGPDGGRFPPDAFVSSMLKRGATYLWLSLRAKCARAVTAPAVGVSVPSSRPLSIPMRVLPRRLFSVEAGTSSQASRGADAGGSTTVHLDDEPSLDESVCSSYKDVAANSTEISNLEATVAAQVQMEADGIATEAVDMHGLDQASGGQQAEDMGDPRDLESETGGPWWPHERLASAGGKIKHSRQVKTY
jgi:hypothetical protein